MRGKITEFSSASRRRLLEALAWIPQRDFTLGLFITLTYARNMADPVRSERDLQVLFQRMERVFGRVSMFWRRERQKRGAIHYHLLLLGRGFVPKEWLAAAWADITGDHRPFTRVERL